MKKAKVSKYGQWQYPGEHTIVPAPTGQITMQGVPYPVLGIDNQGNQQMMMPGGEYQFPGNSVYEIPMMAYGGYLPKAQSIGEILYVNSEDDPAYTAYNDSLGLYNKSTAPRLTSRKSFGAYGSYGLRGRNVTDVPLPEGYTVPGPIQPIGQRITRGYYPEYVIMSHPPKPGGKEYRKKTHDIYKEPTRPVVVGQPPAGTQTQKQNPQPVPKPNYNKPNYNIKSTGDAAIDRLNQKLYGPDGLFELANGGQLPKAQNGIDWEGLSNPELGRRAKAAGWDNVDQYRNAKWAYNTTAPGTPKADLPKFPTRVGPTKEAAVLDANQKEQMRKFAEEHPKKGSYPNDPAGLPSVPIFEAALMAPVALESMAGLFGTELLGTGVTAGNIVNPAFAAHGVYNFANPDSDFRKALTAYDQGKGDWRDVAFEGGLNALNFLGAGALPGDIKAFGKGYQNIATGESTIPYAWKSPAVGLSQEASADMFKGLVNSGKLTPAERNIILEYQHNSNPFTGRFGSHTLDVAKRDALNNIINKYQLQFPQNSNVIATRRFNSKYNNLGANIENGNMNFGDRPTSFSAGVGEPGYGGAPDRLVIPSRYLPKMKNNFIANEYSVIPKEHLELIGQPSSTSREKLIKFGSGIGTTNKTVGAEKELIGTGLDFKQIGKVKNDIGGFDYMVKPKNIKAGASASTSKTTETGETLNAAQSSNVPENLAKQGYKSTHKELADLTDKLRNDRVKFWQTPTGKSRLEAVVENTPELKAAGITTDDYIKGIENMTVENRTAANNLMRGKVILEDRKMLTKEINDIDFLERQTGMQHSDKDYIASLEERIKTIDKEFDNILNAYNNLRVNSKYKNNAFMSRNNVVKSEPGAFNLQKIGVNKDTRFTTGVGPKYDLDEAERIINHEFGHLIQRGVKTNLDKELEGLDLLKNEASDLFSSANKKSSYFDDALDYFKSGSKGKEKLPFLEEVRADMLQKGIIKDFGDPITEGMLRNHYANYMMEGRSDKGSLRMYDIIKNNPKNFTLLKSVMNKMPVAIIGAGVGSQMMDDEEGQPLPQKKRGGGIKNADFLATRNKDIVNSLPKAQTMGEVPYEISTKRFNTNLRGAELEAFNKHAQQFPSLATDTGDYDTQGFYKEVYNKNNGNMNAITAALTPGSETAHVGTDRYKKPNHPTFSKESKYYIPLLRPAGEWGHNEEDNYDYFNASRRNIRNMTKSDGSPLEYFKRAEDYDQDGTPDVKLFYKDQLMFNQGGDVKRVTIKSLPKNWKTE